MEEITHRDVGTINFEAHLKTKNWESTVTLARKTLLDSERLRKKEIQTGGGRGGTES